MKLAQLVDPMDPGNWVYGKLMDQVDNGCYVEGHWGWRGVHHLIEQFGDPEPEEAEVLAKFDSGEGSEEVTEQVYEWADKIENDLNDALPDEQVAHWVDGEFFIDYRKDLADE